MRPIGPTGPQHFSENADPGAGLRVGVSISPQTEKNQAGPPVPGEKAGPFQASPTTAGLDSLLRAAGLPVDLAGRLSALSLLAEGLRPGREALQRLRSLATSGEGGGLERRLRLAAQLEAKGLGATREGVDLLLRLIEAPLGGGAQRGAPSGSQDGGGSPDRGSQDGGGSPDRGSQDGGGPGGGSPEGGASGGGQGAEADGRDRDKGREEASAELGSRLRKACLAASDEAAGLAVAGEGGVGSAYGMGAVSLLQLFNHARAARGAGDWTLVPFAFSLDSVAFEGSFRIQLPYMRGGPGCIEARFHTRRDSGRAGEAVEEAWDFSLFFGTGRPRLLFREGGRLDLVKRLLPELARSLAAYDCRVEIMDGSPPRLDLGLGRDA